MRIIEKLWRPNPKDVAGGLMVQTRFMTNQNFSGALATVLGTGVVTCPINTTRTLTLLNVQLQPGAGQIAQSVALQLISNGVVAFGVSAEPFYVKAAAAGWQTLIPLIGGVMLRPNDTVNVNGVFSAGGVSNSLTFQIYGYDLPIGNVQ